MVAIPLRTYEERTFHMGRKVDVVRVRRHVGALKIGVGGLQKSFGALKIDLEG